MHALFTEKNSFASARVFVTFRFHHTTNCCQLKIKTPYAAPKPQLLRFYPCASRRIELEV